MLDTKTKCTPTNSVCRNGRFENPWPGFQSKNPFGVVGAILWSKDNSNVPTSESVLHQTLPVVKPDFGAIDRSHDSGNGSAIRSSVSMTWLGHSSLLISLEGVKVLCDPIFSSRCSPFRWIGIRRYRPPPCRAKDLPTLDAVVISHTHYDHLDENSVRDIDHFQRLKKVEDEAPLQWFVPLGCAKWFRDVLGEHINVTQLDWWEECKLLNHSHVRVAFTPTQHWSGRSLFDRNKCLWGSWCILGRQRSAFFTGDTAYCEAFVEIGKKYGPFDIAAIPIGAYEPRDIFSPQHVDAFEAVQIHKDIQSHKSLGIHWGTFRLTREHYLEPPQKLKEALRAADLSLNEFSVVNHGETMFADVDGAEAAT